MAKRAISQAMEEFCLQVVKPAMTEYEAYLIAYPKARGVAQATVKRRIRRLMKNKHVIERIKELRALGAAKAGTTLQQHIADLRDLKEAAIKGDTLSVAVRAEELIGKAAGYYREHLILETESDKTPEELAEAIAPVDENPALHEVLVRLCAGEDMPPERVISICQRHMQDIPKVA